MVGRLVYADVPARGARGRWLEPLLWGSNVMLYGWHAVVTPRTEIRFREPLVPEDARTDARPLIYITWHRLNFLSTPVLLSLPAEHRPTLLMHDGVASRAFSHHCTRWMGFEAFVFRLRSSVSPREQIASYVRSTGRPILNLPDSGGPYGVVKPGILEVAKACNARLVPFQVTASRALSVGSKLRHQVPLPGSRLDVRRGAPLDSDATRDECQRALDALA